MNDNHDCTLNECMTLLSWYDMNEYDDDYDEWVG